MNPLALVRLWLRARKEPLEVQAQVDKAIRAHETRSNHILERLERLRALDEAVGLQTRTPRRH